jgi:SRSO17 transposase
LRAYVTAYLHAPDAVGVIDETGFLKKGRHSAGVARQYSGTAGRIEHSQIGVFLAYASRSGHTLLDRELYLPAEWTAARERCRCAGIPEDRTFATKPALARQMLARTLTAGVVAWLTGGSIYGDDRALRQWLEEHRQAYVLAVSGKESVWLQPYQRRISTLLGELPAAGWARLSAGMGSKGPREPTAMTAYIVSTPATTILPEVVRVAGMRWTVEESIQTAKGEVGLDHYEVRSWTGWYRHITLAMGAQAFLAVVRAATETDVAPKKGVQRLMTTSVARFKAHRGLRSA